MKRHRGINPPPPPGFHWENQTLKLEAKEVYQPVKTTDISRSHHRFPCEMTSYFTPVRNQW